MLDRLDEHNRAPYIFVRQLKSEGGMAKRGPVPRGEFHNKSAVLSTRIREDTRAALERAAAASGKSLSQEIEYRLRSSFDKDRVISAEFGNRQNYALLRLLASLFDSAPNEGPWLHDPENFNHILDSINRVLIALRPNGADSDAETDRLVGELNAAALADELARADPSMPPDQAANRFNYVKAGLGEAVAGRLRSLEELSGMNADEPARNPRREK
jgi:hypothetical protein